MFRQSTRRTGSPWCTCIHIPSGFGFFLVLLACAVGKKSIIEASAFSTVATFAATLPPSATSKNAPITEFTTTTANLRPHHQQHVLRASPHEVEDREISITSLHDAESETITTNINRSRTKRLIPQIALVTLLSISLAAEMGLLPGPLLKDGTLGPYTDGMIARDVGSATLTAVLGYLFVKANTWLADQQIVQPRDSRKIIHTFSAPLFMVFWPLFSPAEGARFFAASVSFVNAVRLFVAGSGGDKSLAHAVSRSGEAKEALGGPFLYVVILMAAILTFWRDSPVGIVALSAMAAGDGLADIVGRRWGKNNKWWFNQQKSMAGTCAFWVGATSCAWLLLQWLGIELVPAVSSLSSGVLLAGIMLVTAFLELVPWKLDDNWVVPLSAAVLTSLAFS